MDIERIRQNLGHASAKTTQIYIGVLDTDHVCLALRSEDPGEPLDACRTLLFLHNIMPVK